MGNPYEDPEFKEFERNVRENLVPKVEQSAFVMSLVPENGVDPKFAVELGVSIMLDKPIIACVMPGVKVPEKLVLVADVIVEVDPRNPAKAADSIKAAMDQLAPS